MPVTCTKQTFLSFPFILQVIGMAYILEQRIMCTGVEQVCVPSIPHCLVEVSFALQ